MTLAGRLNPALNQSRGCAVVQSNQIAIKFGTAEARRLNSVGLSAEISPKIFDNYTDMASGINLAFLKVLLIFFFGPRGWLGLLLAIMHLYELSFIQGFAIAR